MHRFTAVVPSLVAFTASLAVGSDCPSQFGCPHCQSCDKTCVVRVEQVDGEEDCYEIECEEVCIPVVRFPWESCRTAKCGRVRRVARLKEESRETKVCEYDWEMVCTRCGRCPVPAAREGETSTPPLPDPSVPPMPPAAPAAERTVGKRRSGLGFERRSVASGISPVAHRVPQ